MIKGMMGDRGQLLQLVKAETGIKTWWIHWLFFMVKVKPLALLSNCTYTTHRCIQVYVSEWLGPLSRDIFNVVKYGFAQTESHLQLAGQTLRPPICRTLRWFRSWFQPFRKLERFVRSHTVHVCVLVRACVCVWLLTITVQRWTAFAPGLKLD